MKTPLTSLRKLLLTARFWFPLPPFAVFRKTVTPVWHSLGMSMPITTFQFLFPVLWLDSLFFFICLAALLWKFVGKFPFLTFSHQVPISNLCQDAQYPNLILFVVLLNLSKNMPK